MTDFFVELTNQTIGKPVPADLLAKAYKTEKKDSNTIYYFTSDTKSEPHWLICNDLQILLEGKFYIKQADRAQIESARVELGEPEFIYHPTLETTWLAYPTLGKAFYMNTKTKVINRLWHFETTSVSEFSGRFKPQEAVLKEQREKMFESSIVPTDMMASDTSSSVAKSIGGFSLQAIGLIVLVIMILIGIGGIFWWRKKANQNQPLPPQMPTPPIGS